MKHFCDLMKCHIKALQSSANIKYEDTTKESVRYQKHI